MSEHDSKIFTIEITSDSISDESTSDSNVSVIEQEWVELKCDKNYEICTSEPHQIRRKRDKRIISETLQKHHGYIVCKISQKQYRKHRILANQFLNLDLKDKLKQVDHINAIRTDNRLENLRVVTHAENMKNRNGMNGKDFEFVDKLPDDVIGIIRYGKHQLRNIFYSKSTDTFFLYNGVRFRKIKIEIQLKKYEIIRVYNTDGKEISITPHKLINTLLI